MQQRQTARQNYLQAEVHTATPQKLQLLLVEAAIKNIHRTKQAWKEQKFDEGFETLSRSQDIVAEILCSLDVEGNPDIAKKLASIYIFIFRRLAEGGMAHSEEKLDDALRVLGSERETWRLVCEKFGSTVGTAPGGNVVTSQAAASNSSVSYTPSAPTSSMASAGSSRLDLSGPPSSAAKVLVPPASSSPAGTFARPAGTNSFAMGGARPLGASPIKTDSTLAGGSPAGKTLLAGTPSETPPNPSSVVPTLSSMGGKQPGSPNSGYYTSGTTLGNLGNLSTTTTPKAPQSNPTNTVKNSSGGTNNWDA